MNQIRLQIIAFSVTCLSLATTDGHAGFFKKLRKKQTQKVEIEIVDRNEGFGIMTPEGERHVVLVAGQERPQPSPLVIVFHGRGMDGAQIANMSGFHEQAKRKGFVVAFPDGPIVNENGRGWKLTADEIHFVESVIAEVKNRYAIDDARIYAAGFSNGGIFTYYLACMMDVFAAIGVVSGTSYTAPTSDGCRGPVSVIHVHGEKDDHVGFNSATEKNDEGITLPAASERFQAWREWNGCDDSQEVATTKNTKITSYTHCGPQKNETRAMLVVDPDGAHVWPRGKTFMRNPKDQLPSPQGFYPSTDLDATPLIWEFLVGHAKP